jgi:hypothetical protein
MLSNEIDGDSGPQNRQRCPERSLERLQRHIEPEGPQTGVTQRCETRKIVLILNHDEKDLGWGIRGSIAFLFFFSFSSYP